MFIIFDVEVALFFPWATVFGKASQLADPSVVSVEADGATLTPAAAGLFRELGLQSPAVPALQPTRDEALYIEQTRGEMPASQALGQWAVAKTGRLLARTAVVDMGVFFAVLLTGFAYVWYRGDLDWVRAVSAARAGPASVSAERSVA